VGPTGCASTIFLVTSIYLVLGLIAFIAWGATNNVAWVESFFRMPGALLLAWLAGMEFWLSNRVRKQLLPDEPLHAVWAWITLSALCHFVAALFAQIFSANSAVNPFVYVPGWTEAAGGTFRQVGLVIGGTLRYGLLAAGLFRALGVYRRAGFLGTLTIVDWLMLTGIGAYIFAECGSLGIALRAGKQPTVFEVVGWPVDPLLWLLVAEALLLHRSVQRMGPGRISKCWRAFSLGAFLVLLGDLGLYVTNYGYLAWPWSGVIWYIWLPAACTFALAPAYQLEAMWYAGTARSPSPDMPLA
jgi:hypothetical protein